MSEAPRKIWVPEVMCNGLNWDAAPGKEIPYIRADIVDELVAASRKLVRSLDWDKEVQDKNWWFEARKEVRDTLKNLED